MGMYTHFVLTVNLNKDFEYYSLLDCLLGNESLDSIEPSIIPDHEFFKTTRWRFCLSCECEYLPGASTSNFYEDYNGYKLTIVTKAKNYDDEFQKFLSWISQWVSMSGYCGFIRYEEDKMPQSIFFEGEFHLMPSY